MAKHGPDERNRRKGDPFPPAATTCPWCHQKITNGPIPRAIHKRVCPKRPKNA